MKNFLLVFILEIINFMSFGQNGQVVDESLINQAIYTMNVTQIKLPCQLLDVQKLEQNQNFVESNPGIIFEIVPDSLSRFLKEAYIDLYQEKEKITFFGYNIKISNELSSRISTINISKIGFSKNKLYALLYFELSNIDNQGNGAFVFLTKEKTIWEIKYLNYTWKS